MNATVETLPNCLATLHVEVGPEVVSKTREKIVGGFLNQARIPGFRPGKSPRHLVENRFKKEISEETESELLTDSLRTAIREKELKVLRVSNIEDIKNESTGFSFSATVITVPEFELPEYKGIPVHIPAIQEGEKEKFVESILEDFRARQGDFLDLQEDRGAAMEDFIVVDYKGTIDGRPVHEVFPKVGEVLTKNEDFWVRMTDEAFFPGFCKHLIDARPGELREFQIEVPADFPVEGFSGQKIDYAVTLKEIKVRVLPELDDEFAGKVAGGQSLADLKERIRAEFDRLKEAEAANSKRNQVMEYLISRVECELPEEMARRESARTLSELVEENQRRGVTQEMLRNNEKELVASASQTGRNRLKGSFILSRVAEQEKLNVTRDEVLSHIAGIAQRAGISLEKAIKDFSKRQLLPEIENDILNSKALERILSQVVVTETNAEDAPAS
jgi:trigger factor